MLFFLNFIKKKKKLPTQTKQLGYFDPYARKDLNSPETPQAYDRMTFRKCLLNFDRVKWWMVKGATVSRECQAVLSQAGLMPPVFDVHGSKHGDRFDWGSKDDLYDYWLKTKPTAAEAVSEDRYQYYDGVPGQPTPSGKFDSERENARSVIYNQLQTPSGIRQHLLGTNDQRELSRWRGPIGSLPRSRFIQNAGPDNVFGAGWS